MIVLNEDKGLVTEYFGPGMPMVFLIKAESGFQALQIDGIEMAEYITPHGQLAYKELMFAWERGETEFYLTDFEKFDLSVLRTIDELINEKVGTA